MTRPRVGPRPTADELAAHPVQPIVQPAVFGEREHPDHARAGEPCGGLRLADFAKLVGFRGDRRFILDEWSTDGVEDEADGRHVHDESPETYEAVRVAAARAHQTPSALIRQWVTERVEVADGDDRAQAVATLRRDVDRVPDLVRPA